MVVRKTVTLQDDAEEWILRRVAITHQRRGQVIYDAFMLAAILYNRELLESLFPRDHIKIRKTLEQYMTKQSEIPLPESFDD